MLLVILIGILIFIAASESSEDDKRKEKKIVEEQERRHRIWQESDQMLQDPRCKNMIADIGKTIAQDYSKFDHMRVESNGVRICFPERRLATPVQDRWGDEVQERWGAEKFWVETGYDRFVWFSEYNLKFNGDDYYAFVIALAKALTYLVWRDGSREGRDLNLMYAQKGNIIFYKKSVKK